MKNSHVVFKIYAVILLLLKFTMAQVSVVITNSGFESESVSEGGLSSSVASGWSGNYSYNPASYDFSGATGLGASAGAEGVNVGILQMNGSKGFQELSEVFRADSDYSFTLAVGQSQWYGLSDFRFGIGDRSGTIVKWKSITSADLSAGSFSDFTLGLSSAEITSAGALGNSILLTMEITGNGFSPQGYANAFFDNARLSYVAAVPESRGFVLGGFIIFAFWCLRNKNFRFRLFFWR